MIAADCTNWIIAWVILLVAWVVAMFGWFVARRMMRR